VKPGGEFVPDLGGEVIQVSRGDPADVRVLEQKCKGGLIPVRGHIPLFPLSVLNPFHHDIVYEKTLTKYK